jgi:RecJ-like exonuclease
VYPEKQKPDLVVGEWEEVSGGMWGMSPRSCPECEGTGRKIVGAGEIMPRAGVRRRFWFGKGQEVRTSREVRRLERARRLRCRVCRGSGTVIR